MQQVHDSKPVQQVHESNTTKLICIKCLSRSPYNRKSALDAGDYGLGFAANSLELGCDCLGEVTYFDGVVNNAAGEPVVVKNAVCLHEEDHGLLWKHLDYRWDYNCCAAGAVTCGWHAAVTDTEPRSAVINWKL